MPVCLSVSQSVCLCVCVCVCPSLCTRLPACLPVKGMSGQERSRRRVQRCGPIVQTCTQEENPTLPPSGTPQDEAALWMFSVYSYFNEYYVRLGNSSGTRLANSARLPPTLFSSGPFYSYFLYFLSLFLNFTLTTFILCFEQVAP